MGDSLLSDAMSLSLQGQLEFKQMDDGTRGLGPFFLLWVEMKPWQR